MSDSIRELTTFSRLSPGEEIGVSPWVLVDQDMITNFGDATRDPDPMHVDPDWARANGPYGGTIAFGFLTISLLTHLLHSALGQEPGGDPAKQGHFLNYGMDYLRLVSPVPVDSRVRGRFKTLEKRVDDKGREIVKMGCEIEIEGGDRPALVAEWLAIWVPPEDGDAA